MNPTQDPAHHVLARDAGKPYLMLLHGVMSSRVQWMDNVEALKAVCNPVLVELLGHGQSPAPTDPARYTPQAYAAYFDALREDLGATDWFVCDQSFSAGLTMRYSLLHPQRVRGQIFTNSVSAFMAPDTPERLAERAEGIARLRRLGREALPDQRFFPRAKGRLPDAVYEAMLADALRIDPEALALCNEVTVPGLSMRDEFHRITVPTLLINGAWEKAFQPVAQKAGELMPAMRRVDLDGGHTINAENPVGFNQAVIDFIRSLA